MTPEATREAVRDISVRIWRGGSGRPLLFLHGAGGHPGWLPLFDRLAAKYALTVPEQPVDVLLVPVCAPWMRAAEGIDFARAVGAPRNLAIHDRIYSEAGLRIVDSQYGLLLPESSSYTRVADGADLD